MAEVTAMRNNALPYPVYALPYVAAFPLLDADGDPISPSSPDSEISKNGDTFADCTNEATEIATSSGICYLSLTSTELTTDVATVQIKSTGAKTTVLALYPRKLPVLRSGTGASGGASTSTIVLDSGASAVDDYYNGCIVSSNNDGTLEVRMITDYTGSSKTATVVPDWNLAPDNNDAFTVYIPDGRQIVQSDVTAISAVAVSTTTAQLGVNVVNAAGTAWNSGAIGATTLAADTITAAKVADGTIDAATFAASAITATAIAADAITAAKIADGAIDAATFAASAITATAIASNAITSAKIAADAIGATQIADGAIDAATFATGAITATAIAADAIGASELAADAVAEIAAAVWDLDATGHQTTGTFGQAIGDPAANTATIYAAVVTNAAGTDVAADIIAIKAETASILTDTAEIGAAGAGLTALASAANLATVDTVVDGIAAAIGTPTDLGAGATLSDNNTDMAGATFDTSTDSLEAIRNRGDAAWTTGAGGTPPELLNSTIIATLASQTSFTLTAGSTDDDAYNGAIAIFTDQLTATQKAVGTISDYTGLTKTVTLSADPGIFTIATGDTIDIIAALGSSTGSGLDAAGVRAAIGLASANLDTQLGDIQTAADAILVDTAEIGTAGAGLTNINLPNQTMDIVGNITGNLSGSVGSVTGAVGSVTGNVGGNVTGTVASVVGNVGGNVTGSIGSLATQAKADVNAEADAALADYDGPTHTELTAELATADDPTLAAIAALNNLSAAQVNAEVVDALATDTYAEPGQATPAATATLASKINYLYKHWRNKKEQTATDFLLYNDNGTTVGQTATVSDDGTTASRGKLTTGT